MSGEIVDGKTIEEVEQSVNFWRQALTDLCKFVRDYPDRITPDMRAKLRALFEMLSEG